MAILGNGSLQGHNYTIQRIQKKVQKMDIVLPDIILFTNLLLFLCIIHLGQKCRLSLHDKTYGFSNTEYWNKQMIVLSNNEA